MRCTQALLHRFAMSTHTRREVRRMSFLILGDEVPPHQLVPVVRLARQVLYGSQVMAHPGSDHPRAERHDCQVDDDRIGKPVLVGQMYLSQGHSPSKD